MAKKSKMSLSKSTGKPVSWSLNTIAVANRLKPYPHKDTGEIYVQNQVKDDAGNIVETQDVLLDSQLGEEVFYAVVGDLIGRTPTKQEEANELQAALQVVRGRARSTSPRLPSNPVSSMAISKGDSGKSDAPSWEIVVERSGSPNLEVFIDENGEPYAMLPDGRILPLARSALRTSHSPSSLRP